MSEWFQDKRKWIRTGTAVMVVAVVIYGGQIVAKDGWLSLLLTPDQQGRLLFNQERYTEAAKTFVDPLWQATAWYRAGEFKKAAGIFTGFDTAQGAYNHGNALAMHGKYEEAVSRYERALALNPEWEDARINLTIARQNAEKLKKKGGEGTGGKLGADEIRYSTDKPAASAGSEETVEGPGKFSDTEMRAMWLRRVQTKPADFLRAKFAYQHAVNEESR
jgi:Ca-activated chloride channel family protein